MGRALGLGGWADRRKGRGHPPTSPRPLSPPPPRKRVPTRVEGGGCSHEARHATAALGPPLTLAVPANRRLRVLDVWPDTQVGEAAAAPWREGEGGGGWGAGAGAQPPRKMILSPPPTFHSRGGGRVGGAHLGFIVEHRAVNEREPGEEGKGGGGAAWERSAEGEESGLTDKGAWSAGVGSAPPAATPLRALRGGATPRRTPPSLCGWA